MRALVYVGTGRMAHREEQEPAGGPDEAIVRIEVVGICGSDLHAWAGHDPRRVPPLILGHEAAGVLPDGRRVVLDPLSTCGRCASCLAGRRNLCPERKLIGMDRPGAMAERVAVPAASLIAVPDGLDAAGAALTEPAATGVHALELAGRVLPEAPRKALVIGAGSVGLLAALLLRHRGAEVLVSERNPLRAASAAGEGLELVAPEEAAGVELVIDAVGAAETREAAIAAVAPGGAVVHVGLQAARGGVDARRLTLAEIALLGAYTYTRGDLETALQGLAGGWFGALGWVEERPLAEGARAFEDLAAGRCGAGKVLLRP